MKISLLLLFITLIGASFAQQTDQQKEALELGRQAIQLMDKGEYDKSIELLEKAKKLDPKDINYAYELSYAYYLKADYKKAIKLMEPLLEHTDVNDRVYQMLGNAYDVNGDREKAIQTYQEGLGKFPNSGNLYLELGVVEMSRDSLNNALNNFERGIYADPGFPSNYYWAARFYLSTTEEVWGMIYGEIFMNLERGSKRTGEISKMLYDTYKSEITFPKKDEISVSFSQNMNMSIGEDGNMKLPFPLMAFEPTMSLSVIGVSEINLESLNAIRTTFANSYAENSLTKDYPNILFDFQKKIIDLGHMEAYNYWILMKGNETEFNAWREKNSAQFEAFINWFKDNPLQVDKTHYFHSSMY